MAVQKVDSYHNIMGTNATDINAGWTRASALKFGNETDLSRYSDVVGRPHDIYKLIFFNQNQIGLLALKNKCLVFLDDYGAGKYQVNLKNLLPRLYFNQLEYTDHSSSYVQTIILGKSLILKILIVINQN